MSSSSEEWNGNYLMIDVASSSECDGDSWFEMMSVKISKCSCCEEEEEECATCDLESCEYAICKTCLEQQKNYGALESHLSGPQHKEAYSIWLETLAHISTCMPPANQPCTIRSCMRGRELITHLKDCPKKLSGKCMRCEIIWVGVCAHASHCTNRNCLIPQCRHVAEYKRSKG
ncbi:histone acetyltransferase HAC1-like [Raphanus sativus]|uniref:histone acetyltransferase n=1 Tax=Raphanus sativus TaxID=3726 RepID=A0A9W3CJU9_RAPSA|nr:histone acetyltransferase HAC1-like [Raphanus sativus]